MEQDKKHRGLTPSLFIDENINKGYLLAVLQT
jgi:hypothetical protein